MFRTAKRILSTTLLLSILFFLVAECDVNFSGNVSTDAAISYTLTDANTGRLSLFGHQYTIDHGLLRTVGERVTSLVGGIGETFSGGVRTACAKGAEALTSLVKKFGEILAS